tara:strand:+ start:499 stop:1902 length:1404 start_codon:yes stop_codon:yes gene_type:complete
MYHFLLLSFLIISTTATGQVTIKGFAPAYVGQEIEAYRVIDYMSNIQEKIATATVESDSSFTLYVASEITQKVIIKSKNNTGFLFVQPEAKYSILFPGKDKYTPYRPEGNQVEVGFYNLDSTDINYKMLGFQRWVDYFLGNNYHLKSTDPMKFSKKLDGFKSRVENAYKKDSSSYFKTHVRFTIAGMDNIPNAAERNRYEKHDFYIKHTPIHYHNEAYMLYVKDFYQKMIPRLSNTTNQAVYDGIIQSSPTMIMKALGTEYTLVRLGIRELVMITALTEVYHSDDFPQTNIISILDSLSFRTIMPKNAEIARNLKLRITELAPGGKAPNFAFVNKGKETKTLQSFQEKFLYLHFFDPESKGGTKELPLLIDMHDRYKSQIQFVTIIRDRDLSENAIKIMDSIPWDNYRLKDSHKIWENYNIKSFSQYTLIDAAGYIVSSPALGPSPNGEYETIDKTFFYIQKGMNQE